MAEFERLSDVFNIFEPSSKISQLRAGQSPNSPELDILLELARAWNDRSGGRFDPRIGTSEVNLNAIAKGWIVDQAVAVASSARTLVIDAGGDIRHIGREPIRVGVENPQRPYDNEPPVMTVLIENAALATSGPARRGDHLVDPRTGRTPADVLSSSVVAQDAATADVMATILAVGGVAEGMDFAQEVGVAAALIDAGGQLHRNAAWASISIQ